MSSSKSIRTRVSSREGRPDAKVHCGDFRDLVYMKGEYNEVFDLIFTDPPFNIGQNYDGYHDRKEGEEWDQFIYDLTFMNSFALRPGGRLVVHCPDEMVYQVQAGVHKHGLIQQSEWIIWHYRFGQCGKTKYINGHAHCLVFVKPGGDRTWNPLEVIVESDRASKYNDDRTKTRAKKKKETDVEMPQGMRLPFSVWGVPSDGEFWGRVPGNSKERRPKHPNQLPERYLERIIRGYTNPGDRILDPTGGSGTTVVVGQELGRIAETCDISKWNCNSILSRLKIGAIRVNGDD